MKTAEYFNEEPLADTHGRINIFGYLGIGYVGMIVVGLACWLG